MRIKTRWHLLIILTISIFAMSSCNEKNVVTQERTTLAQKAEREYIAVDLGEFGSLSRRFFPESRVNRMYVKFISVPLSAIVSTIQYEDRTVRLSLLPVKTHLGKVVSGADLLENIATAYEEDIESFSANIIESNSESLDVAITFDREIDFEKEFFSLPVYPSSYLNGEDFDSLGEYRVSSIDTTSQRVELISNDSKPIVITHSEFEVAKAAFEAGDLDIFYLPHSESVRLWAQTVRGELVKVPSNHVYMLGFGTAVPFELRSMLYFNIANQDFINNEMGGFGELTPYPATRRIQSPEDLPQMELSSISYICFVDSDWSYRFYRHLERILSNKNIYLEPVFTDFTTMMHMAQAEDADYVYAFAWDKTARTPISELLGEHELFEGEELDEKGEEYYFSTLPVIPIASPYDYYLIRAEQFKHIIE